MPSSRRGVVVWLVAALVGLALLLAALAATARSPAPVWRLVALAIGAHVPFGLVLTLGWRRWIPGGAWTVVGAAAALRLTLVLAPPALSDDVYRYAWDGRVLGAGYNPYDHAPADATLAHLRGDEWERINNPELRTIYPPMAQALFAAWAAIWPTATGFKLLSSAFDIGVLCMIILLAGGSPFRRRGSPRDEAQHRAVLAGVFYGLNPTVCIETGMSGHVEPLALLPMLVAVLLSTRVHAGGDPAPARSGFGGWLAPPLLGLACATKLAPTLLWPVLARRDWRFWLGVPIVLVAVYLPFSSAGQDLFETTGTFVRAWEGNAGLFALLKAAAARVIGCVAGVAGPDEIVRVAWLDGLARALEGTFFTLHKDGGFDPTAPGAFTLNDLSLAAAKIAAGLCLITVLAACVARRCDPLRAAVWLFGATILLSPVVHPWYVLWVLPFAAVRRDWPWLLLGGLVPLAYLPLDGWWARSAWESPAWVPWVEYGPFFAAVAGRFIHRRIVRAQPADIPDRRDTGRASG